MVRNRALVLAVVPWALVVAFYVLREHWGHMLGLLPYVLLAACPLLHLFAHGRHGSHRHHGGGDGAPRNPK